MLAVVKTLHASLRMEGDIPKRVLTVLKAEYGKNLVVKADSNDALVDVFETDWYSVGFPAAMSRILKPDAGP